MCHEYIWVLIDLQIDHFKFSTSINFQVKYVKLILEMITVILNS